MSAYETLTVETQNRVGIITLNRPRALNALNSKLATELGRAATELDNTSNIGCLVLTGSDRAFAAGADIKEMADKSVYDMTANNPFAGLEEFGRVKKPIVAAIAGYALGGGCELAMMCDVLLAADNAVFGQPEINLGVIPGLGGTQRLSRAVGPALAADLVLTGRNMDAEEALRAGLVSRVVPAAQLRSEAMSVAGMIAAKSLPVIIAAKAALRAAQETTLAEGLRYEQRTFTSLFALDDQKEGMAAFRDKRAPDFQNR
ncbi:enoyl-CoA hydratase [Microbacterium halimionae]|uniref:Probable enoyl-CoA hydratase echA8 n=1 Tax=Microbacterium halimionae TaxID=1526413 RepID=A0A7W3JLQ6_9MICO|nr:enoyl-CoA hydratase-related protein [Microbacterium halimionae]MBA8815101.1 enoyl-CoA hydratase [Microbacterium halimionae]NII94108.1 enoyl-CoA hydratase [Microbacterium halimionae]